MPLDLDTDVDISGPESYSDSPRDLSELRVSLIGNKDLKFKLVGDVRFIQTLVNDVKSQILRIVSDSSPSTSFSSPTNPHPLNSVEFLDDLERKAVIINILCSFISEVNTNKHENITTCLKSLEDVINPIVQLLNYFMEKFVPLSFADRNDAPNKEIIAKKVEALINYCLDIFLNLANIRNHTVTSDKLWRFITSLLIIGENPDYARTNWSLLIKSLKLVPIMLSGTRLNNTYSIASIITLLTALLKRLSRECDVIVSTHFPQFSSSPEILNHLAFEDTNLPNIELNKILIRTNINPSLLVELITCTAQIFSFFKANDYDILMASPISANSSTKSAATTSSSITPNLSRTPLKSSVVVLSINVYLSLLLLVKYDDRTINLAALNLIFFYLNNFRPSNEMDDRLIFKNYTKLFPKIIEMLELDNEVSKPSYNDGKFYDQRTARAIADLPMYLYSPGRILADLCSQYPLLNDEIKDANIDLKVVKNLELIFKNSQLLKALRILKKNSKHGNTVVDFTALLSTVRDDSSIADLLLLLSVYTSSTEEYRHRIISYPTENTKNLSLLPQIIFEVIDNYHFLLKQIQLIYRLLHPRRRSKPVPKKDLPWFGRNLGIVRTLIDSSIFTNCFYLVRSLSRSVSTLRTFFVECNSIQSFITKEGSKDTAGGLITNFLQILKSYETSDQIGDFFNNLHKKDKVEVSYYLNKRAKMTNKAAALGILANFILDFSSFRYSIVNYDNFLQSLSIIYQNATTSAEVGNFNLDKLSDEDIFQRNVIQLNILRVIKNFMFNETNENKKELLDYFPLIFLFQKTTYGLCDYREDEATEVKKLKAQQKLVAFDILRNFTAGSPNFNAILINSYEKDFVTFADQVNLPRTWSDYIVATIRNVKIFTNLDGSIDEDDEFLMKLVLNDDYVGLVTSINYIEDHKYTIIDKIKRSVFPDDELLHLWIRFLDLTPSDKFFSKLDLNEKINLNNNLNEIKSSIVWIIINLTWKYSTYGFSVHEGSNYNLFDTVEGYNLRPGTLPSRRILVEESEDSDTENTNASEGTNDRRVEQSDNASAAELTVRDRAVYLQKFGFGEVLVKLINQYAKQFDKVSATKERKGRENGSSRKNSTSSESKKTGIERSPAPKRFDIQNSHDLLEKLKTANHQITSLLRGGGRVSNNSNVPRLGDGTSTIEIVDDTVRRVRRISGAGSARSSHPIDVNRGGEGFGYDSDDYNADARGRHGSESTSVDDQEMENADRRVDEEEDDDLDDPAEYWVM
ncbi:uncharacterized protein RJT20DRAFT_124688 [Scheffersomyces xylosifermentans]|uniref:uncharacterized protein n=1 Tax=Scheffersomyces xylosifermentans TaxID=1304137 RepID=UPI00315D95C1